MFTFNSIHLIERKQKFMLKYLLSSKRASNLENAFKILMHSQTYALLINEDTCFYLKSDENLVYILELELSGNIEKWHKATRPMAVI